VYAYDAFDQRLVEERAAQFRDQVLRRIDGTLSEEEFKPLRLQNGLYMQLHAYMLRVAVPYGLLASRQLRKLGHVARTYDRGYAHFTTRQNVQLNWPRLEDVPAILDELAEVQMHAIQTSGNCIRNITADPHAGVAADEVVDPRPYCEILRQWSTFHPEFAFLPRKFKLAVTGAPTDRAAIQVHDIGLRAKTNDDGEVGFEVYVGGGQGRTPVLAAKLRDFLPEAELVAYCEAILRTYNRLGRRDNKYKARIKILVQAVGPDAFREKVEEEHARIRDGELRLRPADVARFVGHFRPPVYAEDDGARLERHTLSKDRGLARWVKTNVSLHRQPGHAIVNLALKAPERPPGDVTADQLDALADLADRYSHGRAVATHRQNVVLPDVRVSQLAELHRELREHGFATANLEQLTDVVCCPGLDYCNLASARSIHVAQDLLARFRDLATLDEVGPMHLNISGCINACGHHHVGHVGILGIDKKGVEHYQLMLGGSSGDEASLGKVLGRALTTDEIGPAVERLTKAYLELRESSAETFLACYRRVGPKPFKEAVYGHAVAR
jgi:sulfite reductase (NADPH) hemoprotein beta-component